MDKLIYLDNAATTKTSPEVVEAMLPYFTEHYGNPSSIYSFAAANKEVISKQRETIAGVIGAKENEIYFTAGGTEADNWALTATAAAYARWTATSSPSPAPPADGMPPLSARWEAER